MKKLHLLYNSIAKEYYFSTASNPYLDKERKVLQEENLLKFMTLNVNLKRKSLLALLNIREDIAKKMEALFKDSNILIETKADKI
jgi:hypothetical protein